MEREQEKQIREERENFFTCVAHELRTPLTLVLSPLQELLHRKTNADPDYKALSLMYENGNSLHRLVDDLLSVQKIEAGVVKIIPTLVEKEGAAPPVTNESNTRCCNSTGIPLPVSETTIRQ